MIKFSNFHRIFRQKTQIFNQKRLKNLQINFKNEKDDLHENKTVEMDVFHPRWGQHRGSTFGRRRLADAILVRLPDHDFRLVDISYYKYSIAGRLLCEPDLILCRFFRPTLCFCRVLGL